MHKTVGKERSTRTEEDGAREDVEAWKFGMAFIIVLIAAMFALGWSRGWDATSGHTHNMSATSRERFLPEPFTEELNVWGRHGVDATSRWHYWKLPPHKVTVVTRATVWVCYSLHQIFVWLVTYEAQATAMKTKARRYSTKMASFNWKAVYINIGFHVVHLVQTHLTYDALAQDVSVASPQASATMLLVFVLLMEYRDRGLAFGWPTEKHQDCLSRKLRFGAGPIDFIRKYHGYAFAWTAVYSFWYHPMENTWAHATGIVHTWLLMLQGSLMYTRLHLNRYWRLLLEFWVTVHSTTVAVQAASPSLNGTATWPMFACGFLWLFFMTQLHGLPFWKKLPGCARFLPFIGYGSCVVWLFSWLPEEKGRPWVRMNEAVRIPAFEYVLAVLAWFVMALFLRVKDWLESPQKPSQRKVAPKIASTVGLLLIYVSFLAVSWLVQALDLEVYLIPLMLCLCTFYTVGTCLSFVLIHQILQVTKQSVE